MPSANASALKVARSRERKRAAGLRPVQFWVPDTRQDSYATELRMQCLALKGDLDEAQATAFAEAAAQQVEGWV